MKRPKEKTPRLNKQGQVHERWDRLFRFDVPRYIRVYDNDHKSFDRYTVVYSSLKIWYEGHGSVHPYVGMSEHPFHPQGFGQHGESKGVAIDYPTYGHLGKKVVFADLPLDCQWLVLNDYCGYWNLERDDHPLAQCMDVFSFGMCIKEGMELWRPVRPPKGQFDSRSDVSYRKEKALLNDVAAIRDWISIVTDECNPTDSDIAQWSYADRSEVLNWATLTHLAASDNPVKVPETPSILLRYGGIHATQ
jgi:hypothetical protein